MTYISKTSEDVTVRRESQTSGFSLYRSFGKRALDILLVVASLPVILPVILIIACLIKLDGGRPFIRSGGLAKTEKPLNSTSCAPCM